MPELRKDPIVGRWVIISTDRAKRPTDFVREPVKIKGGGFCPFDYGNESKTPPEILAYRPSTNGATAQKDSPGWTVRVVRVLTSIKQRVSLSHPTRSSSPR